MTPHFTKTILFTDTDGRARFRAEQVPLTEGTPQSALTPVFPSGGYQLRESPVGFRSQFHCSPHPQWVFILRGTMVIGLQDGSSRSFAPGEHFHSADLLPEGATFDPKVHGHCSAQAGSEPLVTLFVRG
jgi:oxalate decarboxylase/phosphoglucose isomerase-like protein (cupin superfamily)